MADHGGNLAATSATDRGPCPGNEALLAFCSGSLADGDLVTIADHLSQCETCDQAVRGLSSAGDELSSRLRQALEHPEGAEEAALLRMQAAAKALLAGRQDSATAETALDPESEADVPARRSEALATEMWLPPMPAKIGRYNVKSELGRGGFGSVYLAQDPDLDRLVAIKVPKFAAGITDEKIKWFLEEARTAAQLKHPGIVAIYEVGRSSDGSFYIVMEHVAGRSLSEELGTGKPSLERTVQIVAQAAAAIHYAHKKGFVHRDLKPGNILLDADGRVKIADFGLAVHEDQQRGRAGERAGTLAYMSPEQIRGDVHRLDGRTDVWSLGVILYELLTGRRPFSGTPREIADEVLHRPPKPPRQIADHIDSALEAICLKCLAKDCNQRYSSAMDVAEALARWQQGEAQPLPLLRTGRPVRWTWLAPAVVLALAGCVAALFVSGLFGKPEVPYQVDLVARPFVPLPLMDRPPEVIFPADAADQRWELQSEPRQIHMESKSIFLLGLGNTQSDKYRLRVEASKVAPAGYSSLFFGYHPLEPVNGRRRWECQVLSINCGRGGPPFVTREAWMLTETPNGTLSINRRNLADVRIDDLPLNRVPLEVTVRLGRVVDVRAGSRVLRQLADPPKGGWELSTRGRFGLSNSRGSTTFHDAKFESLKVGKPQ